MVKCCVLDEESGTWIYTTCVYGWTVMVEGVVSGEGAR